ncbi:MAG TPA: hypothetical protein ENI41_08820, partial [Deltaproteobacteria bacterium]|nr:hypothetical protein [Deltaproteobacteria bacterium]
MSEKTKDESVLEQNEQPEVAVEAEVASSQEDQVVEEQSVESAESVEEVEEAEASQADTAE